MEISLKIADVIKRQGGMITARQIARAGVSRQLVQLYVRERLLERVSHGVFVTPDGVVDDLLLLSMKVDDGVLSHGTALYLNGLTDRTPFEPTLTIDRDKVLTASLRGSVKCFYVPRELLGLGRVMRKTPLGNEVVTYDGDRTVCDLIRSRSRLDDELVLDGLRHYVSWDGKSIARLGEYARAFGIVEEVRRTLELAL